MFEERKHQSPKLALTGCLLASLLLAGSVFLSGFVLSRRGIGLIGDSDTVTKSPVGVWKGPKGGVIEFRANGTGIGRRDGIVVYFEWRLHGNELAFYEFANPKQRWQPSQSSLARTWNAR